MSTGGYPEQVAVWELDENNEVVDLGSEGTRTRDRVSGSGSYTNWPDE
jgi:hypothetical protein